MANAEKLQRKKRKVSEKSLANLKPFEKGQSGNPKGAEPGTVHNKTRLLQMLENLAPETIADKKEITQFCKGLARITNFDAVNAVLLYRAIIEKDLAAIKEILDRTEGKAAQSVDVTSKGEKIETVVILPKPDDANNNG